MKLKIVLTFLVGMMFWFAMLGDTYTTTDYRSVRNTTTGATSIQLCGPGGSGVFFNSTDTAGVSCIDPIFGFTEMGDLVWIRMQSSIFYETSCYSAFVACHIPPTFNTCDAALSWQAFRKSDMGYAGESVALGGPLVQPFAKEFVCPTPTPSPVPTALTPSITSAPTVAPVGNTPTPLPSAVPTPSRTPSSGCEGALFGLPCPSPSPVAHTPTPRATATTTVPTTTATSTIPSSPTNSPTPSSVATATSTPQAPTSPSATSSPTPISTPSPTAVVVVPSPIPATPVPTRLPSPTVTPIPPSPVPSVVPPTASPVASPFPTTAIPTVTPTSGKPSTNPKPSGCALGIVLAGLGTFFAATWRRIRAWFRARFGSK